MMGPTPGPQIPEPSNEELRARLIEVEAELQRRTEERDAALVELDRVTQKQQGGDKVFRRFSESGIVGIGMFDRQFTMIYANEALLKMTGCTQEEVAAEAIRGSQFIPPENMGSALKALEELTQTGICRPFELQYQRRDGSRFWAVVAAFIVESDGNALAFVLDVTALKLTDEALRLSRDRLDLVQRSIDLGVWYSDLPSGRAEWNERCKRHFGVPPDTEVCGETFYKMILPEDRERVRTAAEQTTAHREGFDEEFHTVGLDGRLQWIRALGTVFYDPDGSPVRFDGVTVDVTEQKVALEKLEQMDRRKDDFLAMLAHELRNPLASIRSAVQILDERGSREPQPVRVRRVILRQTEHLAHLVNDLLDVARVRQGKITLWKETLDLQSVLERSIESCRYFLDARGQEVHVELTANPVCVEGDPARLEQVVCNLLSNAGKYTAEGGHIWLRVDQEQDQAVVRVRDTGIGIPAPMLHQIFDLFTQADDSLDRSQGGLGIGLTLARQIAVLHGGAITAFSEGAGKGSEFVLRLPSAAAAVHGAAPRGVADLPAGARSPGRRVLLVEDNVDAAMCLKEMLEFWDHEVQIVYDGTGARSAALNFRPEVVLCDIGLPGIDGYQVARELRNEPELQNTLLVAMTGYGSEADRLHSQEAGFKHHLIKPIAPDTLQQLIASSPD